MSVSEHVADVAGSTGTAGWVNVSGQVYAFVDPYADADWFVTCLTAGVSYTIRRWVGDFDAVLTLRDAAGGVLSVADRFMAGATETLTFARASSGV